MNVLQEGSHHYEPFSRSVCVAFVILGVMVLALVGAFVTVAALWGWLT